jgi:hypothetical protein
MEQPTYVLKNGTKIRTNPALESTSGMRVHPGHLAARRPDLPGLIQGVVPGHGGDVYWVRHDGIEDTAAYCFTEFELDPSPTPTRIDIILDSADES